MKTKITLEKQVRQNLIEEIRRYFWKERDEEISNLAAEIMLDFIINTIGPHIYNVAISDAVAFMNEKVDDLFALEKH